MIHKEYEGGSHRYLFWCPGCSCLHCYNVNHPSGPNWKFDGNFEKPTFTPSLRYLGGPTGTRCHFFVTNGIIDYCGDNPHSFNGQKVPLQVIDEAKFHPNCDF